MKEIRLEIVVKYPESLQEAINVHGEEYVFEKYLLAQKIEDLQKMRAAIRIAPRGWDHA